MLSIRTIPVGPGQANCYIISNETEVLIIDPGAEANKITQVIAEMQLEPVAILLTHTHFDHIGAVDPVRDLYEIPVYVAPEEKDWLKKPMKNLSGLQGQPITARPAEHLLKAGEILEIASFKCKVLATPGHSPGGVTFVFEEDGFAVVGDALFAGSVGRTDLPGSDHKQLFRSITEELFTLPDHYIIYPGHMEQSTIEKERTTNPFFN